MDLPAYDVPNERAIQIGRRQVALAAILWSLSGAFTKVLTQPTSLGLHDPPIEPYRWGDTEYTLQIACYRTLFAGLSLVPLLRPKDISFRPAMAVMGLCFALMNVVFITSMALGTAATGILLQYSAPLWLYLASVMFLGDAPDRRGTITLFVGVAGIALIVAGGWTGGEGATVVVLGLISGFTYAMVLVFLRVLRTESPTWLTVWNQVLAGLVLLPLVWSLRPPTLMQFATLFLFGFVQLGLAYWLMAKALRVVPAAEAGALSLLEPLLNPVWAYLIASEMPSVWTLIGGTVIVGALAWQYWPRRA